MAGKNTICFWYDGTALDAAQFYAATFPDSAVGAILRAPGDYPTGKEGEADRIVAVIGRKSVSYQERTASSQETSRARSSPRK